MEVQPHERALVIVSYLATKRPYSFYRLTEWSGIWTAKYLLRKQYRRVVVLRGQSATYGAFVNAVCSLSVNASVKAVDIIINMHGNSDGLLFARKEHVPYKEIDFAAHAVPKLRLIYSTACSAANGNSRWLQLGFKSAIGAEQLNINALTEYPAILFAWAHGHTVAEALRRASGPAGKVTDRIGRLFSRRIKSAKVLSGDAAMSIDRVS